MATDATSATPYGAAPVRAGGGPAQGAGSSVGSVPAKAPGAPATGDTVQLSPEAAALVAKLQARDTQVRAHEAAHVAAGGGLITGGPNYSYQRGPDGKNYAVGGDVSIDVGPVPGNPKATIAKAQQIEAAALAPADPSSQDHSVASAAAAMAAQAAMQLATAGAKGPGSARPGSLLDVTG